MYCQSKNCGQRRGVSPTWQVEYGKPLGTWLETRGPEERGGGRETRGEEGGDGGGGRREGWRRRRGKREIVEFEGAVG